MKIYTEINYEFKNGELIEIASKSFDYTGEIAMCVGGGGGGGPVETIKENVVDPLIDPLVETFVEDPLEEVTEAVGEAAAEATGEPEPEPEPDPEYASSTGTGSLQGQTAALQINKQTQGAPGAFTRGSLRVRKPKPIVV
jgi:hypothetical protein